MEGNRPFLQAKVLLGIVVGHICVSAERLLKRLCSCVYACNSCITAERIFIKFDIGTFYENLPRHFSFRLDWSNFEAHS